MIKEEEKRKMTEKGKEKIKIQILKRTKDGDKSSRV